MRIHITFEGLGDPKGTFILVILRDLF